MVMCGAPSDATPVLLARIAAAGCAGRIVPAGIRRDIERFMLASDVLLFPSRGEGLGMVAVEAQAAGLPVIASTAVPVECVVIPELVNFVPLTKSAKEWAEVVLAKLRSGRADNNALANQRVVESPFAIKHSALQLLKIYTQDL
jgi:glycosyltransferase involved in cell wall biosynthesis